MKIEKIKETLLSDCDYEEMYNLLGIKRATRDDRKLSNFLFRIYGHVYFIENVKWPTENLSESVDILVDALAESMHINNICKFMGAIMDINEPKSLGKLCPVSNYLKKEQIAKLWNIVMVNGDEKQIFKFIKRAMSLCGEIGNEFAIYLFDKKDTSLIEKIIREVKNIPVSFYKGLAEKIAEVGSVDNVTKFIDLNNENKKNIPDDALKILMPLVTKTKDASKIYDFTSSVDYTNDSDIWEDLTDAIILTNDLNKIYDFVLKFPKANKIKIVRFLVVSKSFKLVYKFIKDIEAIPETTMNELVIFVSQTNCAEYIYLVSTKSNLTDKHLEILGKAILLTENKKIIAYLLLLLAGKDSENLEPLKFTLKNWLDNNGDREWMETFNPNIHQELEQKLLDSDDEILNPFIDVPKTAWQL